MNTLISSTRPIERLPAKELEQDHGGARLVLARSRDGLTQVWWRLGHMGLTRQGAGYIPGALIIARGSPGKRSLEHVEEGRGAKLGAALLRRHAARLGRALRVPPESQDFFAGMLHSRSTVIVELLEEGEPMV